MEMIRSKISQCLDEIYKDKNNLTYITISEAINVLLPYQNYITYIRNFNDNDNGFMWSSDEEIRSISNLLDFQGHSGASFAITLRYCQKIFKFCFNDNGKIK